MEAKKYPKISYKFICEKCNYKCNKKSEYSKHLLTAKHLKEANGNIKNIQTEFLCTFCNKLYRSRGSLWKHEQKCVNTNENLSHSNDITIKESKSTNIVDTMMHLIKQNQELLVSNQQFKELIVEQQHENKKLQSQLIEAVKDNGNTYNTTNNNQKFNLNFFLNTTCKDAMNMSEFIENINIELQELEDIGKNGYVTGMTNMILSRIKDLDVTKRPLHCTDLKRETMYIKDNDEWSKDTPDNTKLRDMIKIVAQHNYGKLPSWREKYPECKNWNDPKYDFCIDMMRNVLGDMGADQIKMDNKVIKNLSRHLLVDRT